MKKNEITTLTGEISYFLFQEASNLIGSSQAVWRHCVPGPFEASVVS